MDDPMRAGSAFATLGDWPAALAAFEKAASENPADPVARHCIATALLALGRYEEGFPLYARRREIRGFRQPPISGIPEWTGQDLDGKSIVLFRDQGLGDEIMFARFAEELAAAGARVTLQCSPSLVRILSSMRSVTVVSAVDPATDFDYWAFSMDLPRGLRLSVDTLSSTPYLFSQSRRTSARVGVMRRGNPSHPNDSNRSLPDDMQLPFEAMSLAPEDTGALDFQDTAEIIAGLDAVITVDTSVAHLSGALGRPTIIMLPYLACDWRWMQDRPDTPWYSSVRLIRQRHPGDWLNCIRDAVRYLPLVVR